MSTTDWETRCAERRKKQLDSIPSAWLIDTPPPTSERVSNVLDFPIDSGLLTPREIEITETVDLEVLLQKLSSGDWSSTEVTTSFYKRAVIAQQLTNCLTEIFVDRALARAKELDEHLKKTGKVVGPLHGLPISLKDQFTMKGLETIMGYASWIGDYAQEDCVLVEILYECGAVPFVRTNVPQTLMWGETFNNVFGRTTNPYNTHMTPGGSSGGEGALLAMKGSPLGVGTDIGGSVRIPSAFCGLYTLRPSYERLPYAGAVNAACGQESISSVLGPMANSMSAVKIFTKTIIDSEPWQKDPLVVRKEWSQKEYELCYHGGGKEPLCFGIMWDNGIVRPTPPLVRAMEMTKEALQRAGHKVIDWEPHKSLEIYLNAETIFVADGGQDFRTECAKSGEPLIESMRIPGEPYPEALELPLVHMLQGNPYGRSAYELWELHKEKRELRKSHHDHWQATVSRTGTGRPIDAIISPAVGCTATIHGYNTDSSYTSWGNALDYACTVFPVTFVDPNLDKPKPRPKEFYNEQDEAFYQLYSDHMEMSSGSPVGLQLIGRTQEEEAVIAMTEIVDRALGEYKEAQKH